MSYQFILTRNDTTIRAIFALMAMIEQMESTSITTYNEEESKWIHLAKKATKIELDHVPIMNKLIAWRFEKTETLTLNSSESKLLADLWHLTYWKLQHQGYTGGVDREIMVVYYNTMLISLIDTDCEKWINPEKNYHPVIL